MVIQFCLNLLIVCVVSGRAIVVSAEGNTESLPALIRQKRASSSSGASGEQTRPLPETPTSLFPNPPQQIPQGCVRIMKDGREVGFGVIVGPRTVAARASSFHEQGQYRVEYYKCGKIMSRKVEVFKAKKGYDFLEEEAGGVDDVGMADISYFDPVLPFRRSVSKLMMETGIFRHEETILWVLKRTGCN